MKKAIVFFLALSSNLIFCQKESGSGTGREPAKPLNKNKEASITIINNLVERTVLSQAYPTQLCQEEGVVVVQIMVDKNGNVIDAKPGARGTTNSAPCLTSQARIAAMNTKWNASPTGVEKQVGTIHYNFSLKD